MRRIIIAAGMFVFLLTCTGENEVVPPSISSFAPKQGTTGTIVTITGTNLSGLKGQEAPAH